MKPCSICGIVKVAADFQVRRLSSDGRTAACRECLRQRDKIRYPKEKEKRLEQGRRYCKTERGAKVKIKSSRKWIRRNAVKRAAHVILGNAIRAGKVIRMPCLKCGKKAHAHHEDYSKPLDVIWLCPTHHYERHREIEESAS